MQQEDLAHDSATQFADAAWTEEPIVYKDYSHITTTYYSIYVLPHIFSGVVPRMVDGFKCITTDQMVREYLDEWEEMVGSVKDGHREQIILALSKAYLKQARNMKEVELKLEESLALRRYAICYVLALCFQSFRIHCTIKEDSIILLELVAMVGNALSALLILIISACNSTKVSHFLID